MAICPIGHDSASDDFCEKCGLRIGGSPSPGSTGGTASTESGGYGPAGSGSPSGGPASGSSPVLSMPGAGSGSGGTGEPCPNCGTPKVGPFCETCGYKFGSGQPPWSPAQAAPASAPGFPPSAPPPGLSPSAPPWPPASSPPSTASAPPVPSVPSVPIAQPVSPTSPVAPPYAAPAAWSAVVSADRQYYQSVQAVGGPDMAAVSFPGYYAERRFRLTGSQMRIGRRSVSRGIEPEIDLTGPPADPGISRLHAVLIATPDGNWAVLDPGSANGTLVNGNEIPTNVEVPLQDGDRINLGGWTAITVHRG